MMKLKKKISLVLSLVRSISFATKFLAEGGTGLLPLSPTFGADGRQEKDKIVCRHSLARLNASIIRPKKKRLA